MIDYDMPFLKEFNCNGKTLFVIPSIHMLDPNCDEIIFITENLQKIIYELHEYMREII